VCYYPGLRKDDRSCITFKGILIVKATLDCIECLIRQAIRTARIATSDCRQQRDIVDAVVSHIAGMDLNSSPADLSHVAYWETTRITGTADPFEKLKHDQNVLALSLGAEMRELVRTSDAPLHTALHLSAAGNVIDLGTHHHADIDLQAAIEQALRERFAVDHTAALEKSLENCSDLLFLLDNAGEIVFDKILIEELRKYTKVTAVVKGAPVINDVTMADAEQVGLTAVCEVIDNGGPYIGTPLNRVPSALLERMAAADVIIGKGQGNYETVDDYDGDVFLILRAKCPIVADHMGVGFGQVGLISTRLRAEHSGGN